MKTAQIDIPISLAHRITNDQKLLSDLVTIWLQEQYPPNRRWVLGFPKKAEANGYSYLSDTMGYYASRIAASNILVGHIEFLRGYASTKNGQDYIIKERVTRRWGETPVKFKTVMKRLEEDLAEASLDYE